MPRISSVKVCTQCGRAQALIEFHRNVRAKDGLRYSCRTCAKATKRRYLDTAEGEAKRKAARRAYYMKNRDLDIARTKRWNKRNAAKIRARRYGLTEAEFAAMMRAQAGRCKLCYRVEKTALSIDHNHDTGKVRGLLCRQCNAALGLFQDNPELLKRARHYLLGES